ncbi:MAG: hypothetical protein ACRD08_11205, partial [Acidimicrobiales bacterium]
MEHDPPNPLAVVRRILGLALGAFGALIVVLFLRSGRVDGSLLALMAVLWAAYGAATGFFHVVLEPIAGLWTRMMGGSAITLADEIATLEHLLTQELPPEREIQSALRLAEIYRKYRRDDGRADALLA